MGGYWLNYTVIAASYYTNLYPGVQYLKKLRVVIIVISISEYA